MDKKIVVLIGPVEEADFAKLEKRLLEVLPDVAVTDVHTEHASDIFGIPAEKVTPEQRRFAKKDNFRKLYGGRPLENRGTLTGRTRMSHPNFRDLPREFRRRK